MWERGSKYNNGSTELHSRSVRKSATYKWCGSGFALFAPILISPVASLSLLPNVLSQTFPCTSKHPHQDHSSPQVSENKSVVLNSGAAASAECIWAHGRVQTFLRSKAQVSTASSRRPVDYWTSLTRDHEDISSILDNFNYWQYQPRIYHMMEISNVSLGPFYNE